MMTEPKPSPRMALIRRSLVFQLKLLADGFRDFVMVPVSLVATAVGLIRSAEDPQREFQQVLELGRDTERMINLFGTHDNDPGAGTNLDALVDRAEAVLREQVRRGGVSGSAGEALETALERLHRVAGTEKVKGEQ